MANTQAAAPTRASCRKDIGVVPACSVRPCSVTRVRIVAIDQAGKSFAIHKVEDLRKNVATGIHAEACQRGPLNSNV